MSAERVDRDPRLVIVTWLVTRSLLLAVAVYIMGSTGASIEQVLNNWDVGHYTRLATEGYVSGQDFAFFWGLPLLMRGLAAVGLPVVVGVAVLAQLASALAAWALHKIAGPAVASIWLLLPMTVFTAVPYTEPFFAALAFWAWQRGLAGRWAQAGMLAALACTLRISGLFLIAGLGILALSQAEWIWRQRIQDAAWLLLPAAALGAFVVFSYLQTGAWDAWYSAQGSGWQRELAWPWEGFQATWPLTAESYWPGRPEVPIMFRLEIVSVVIGYLTVGWCLLRRRWAEATWVAANVIALSASGWFISVNRAVLLWFPLCIWLVGIGRWRPRGRGAELAWRLAWVGLLVADLVLLVWWAFCFGTGRWAS